MKLAALFSGGKDSTFSVYKTLKEGNKVKYLVTIFPEIKESWMFHHPCLELTKLQAQALGIKQVIEKTKGEKEKELEDLKKVLEKIKPEIEGLVNGAVASNYQKTRIDRICGELGLKSISPLWGKDPEELLKEQVKAGLEIIITSVSTAGLGKEWLGRKIDLEAIEELKRLSEKFGFHLAFEGGEAETFVCDAPIFNKKISIEDFEIVWDERTSSGYLKVKKAKLVSKS